jgi:hypothetical protein
MIRYLNTSFHTTRVFHPARGVAYHLRASASAPYFHFSTALPFEAQHYCRLQFPPLPLQHWPVRRTMKNPLAKNPEKLGYRGTCTVPHSMYHASGVIVNHTDCAQNPKSLFRVDSHTNRLFELRHATTHLQKA